MKKVLIISYFFPPNTTIVSSARPYSWFTEFARHGIEPVAVTRHWSEGVVKSVKAISAEDNRPVEQAAVNGHRVYYLPYRNRFSLKLYDILNNRVVTRPFALLLKFLLILLGIMTDEADIDFAFKDKVLELLRQEKFDAVVLTSHPLSSVKLADRIKSHFSIPVFVDFRDYWNNNLLNENFRFSWRAKLYFYFQVRYIRKWLKNADHLISVSQPILDRVKKICNAGGTVIYNGFEKDLFKEVPEEEGRSKFRITILGALYPTQDLEFMIKGFRDFLKNKKFSTVEICFIGLKYFPEVAAKIEAALPKEAILVTDRIPRKEGLKYAYNSDVLYYIGWSGFKGIFSGKIFEYLGAHKNILIAPNDKDVLEDLITRTNSGKLADTTEQMTYILNSWYQEWVTGSLKYNGLQSEINKYTRENQAKIFAEYILKSIA